GNVDGYVLNQFAMSEQDGILRVATTRDPVGDDDSESAVTTFERREDKLVKLGEVAGLGKGERIFGVRFLGDVGYVVTFRQTDPLYTVDLSDPAAPAVTGELKILGYSAYLHPIGDGRLIGVGQDATEEGRQLGTQVALFDVRDAAAPTRVAQAVIPDASSEAEWDHHAFLWWPDTGLVAVPVSTYTEAAAFSGLIGFGVDVDGGTIGEIGRITHPPIAAVGIGDEPIPPPVLPTEPGSGSGSGSDGDSGIVAPEDLSYPDPIVRSLVVGDRLWTLSSGGLGSSDLATLGGTQFLPFG
ncbi:MAG TPA: beta-propeller domain-containing protein, partial [Acidimicrobiales bacterium]|nr:beta-propeller domain-containing protein [Acidimicrobiales bacterium]